MRGITWIHARRSDTDHDARFLERFADRGVRRLFARVDDSGDRRERAVVGTPAQQHAAFAHDDGGGAHEPQRGVADRAAQVQDEIGGRHPFTLPG